jgi:hypothetical protein
MTSVAADAFHTGNLDCHIAKSRGIPQHRESWLDQAEYRNQNTVPFDTTHRSNQAIPSVFDFPNPIGIEFGDPHAIKHFFHFSCPMASNARAKAATTLAFSPTKIHLYGKNITKGCIFDAGASLICTGACI